MNITSKSRYALQAIIDLAMNNNDSQREVPIADISRRQNIEVTFLEKILGELRRSEIVTSKKGPKGGYALSRSAEEISVREVLAAVSDNQRFTRCSHQKSKGGCLNDKSVCNAHKFWKKLESHVTEFLADYTIYDICYGKANISNSMVLEAC